MHGGHAAPQQTREGDGQKQLWEKFRENAEKGEKLLNIADLNPPNPLQTCTHTASPEPCSSACRGTDDKWCAPTRRLPPSARGTMGRPVDGCFSAFSPNSESHDSSCSRTADWTPSEPITNWGLRRVCLAPTARFSSAHTSSVTPPSARATRTVDHHHRHHHHHHHHHHQTALLWGWVDLRTPP